MFIGVIIPFVFVITQVLGFSDSVYDQLVDIAYYCKASYCSVEPDFQPGPLEDACPGLTFCRNQTTTTIEAIFNPDETQNQISGYSYLTVDHEKKKIYSIFRGTMTDGDKITDVLAFQCPYVPVLQNNLKFEDFENIKDHDELSRKILRKSGGQKVCRDCFVHCGLYVAFMKFINRVFDTAKPFLDQGYELTITGHSLGGGYALLTGAEFRAQGYGSFLITYGSLRVGNPNFNKWVDDIFETRKAASIVEKGGDLPIPSYSRVFQTVDFVPHLPPNIPIILEYGHSGLQFEITKIELPQPKNVVKFKGPPKKYRSDVDETDEINSINRNTRGALWDAIWYPHQRMFINFSLPCEDY